MMGQAIVIPELLSPAGDMERLRTAVTFGADAVYLAASQFGMRSACENFALEELHQAVTTAHTAGVKVYLACNVLMRNQDFLQLETFLTNCADAGVDAVIVSDIGALTTAKKVCPALPIHVSVQTGVSNFAAARTLSDMGASRIVLARELSLEEIAQIRAKTPKELELEAFVHGAMCVSFSGRCLLSDYMTGRSANRGDCAQPCRWSYRLVEEKRPGEYFPIAQDEEGSYILNAKDLCMIEHLPLLAQAGISSFKIEGRAKSAYYTAVITAAYRRAIDDWRAHDTSPDYQLAKEILEEVYKVSHRVYSTGFYFGPPHQGQCLEHGGYVREYDVVGVVLDYQEGRVYVSQRNKIREGVLLDILQPHEKNLYLPAVDLRDEAGNPIDDTPHAQMRYSFSSPQPVLPGSLLRVKHATESP